MTQLNKYSSKITLPASQGASQAMLYATGMSAEDMQKAQVGITSVWYEGNPCNMHLMDLAARVREGVQNAGLVGMRFNTIGVSDGISMGTDGMSYSLQSRDLIADSIETVMSAQWYDANISLPGCDKNMPGCLMAMARLNRPSLMIYGGTIKPGCSAKGDKLDIVSAFQSYGEFISGRISEDERAGIVRKSCPGAGACGGMYTANTMASAIEAMGMTLPYSSSIPAEDPAKLDECFRAGAAIRNLLELDLKPRDIMTRAAFENAMVLIMVTGGSTNAVLHLIAMARAAGVPLTIDDFQSVSDRIPYLADLKPSGKFVMEDLHHVGGTPAVLKYLLEKGLIDGSCMTVTGKTLAENLSSLPGLKAGQQIIRPLETPIKESGHIRIMRGNVCPDGAVAKITGKEGLTFTGKAIVCEGEEKALDAILAGKAKAGHVVVIRNEGPVGAPGMPEWGMLPIPRKLVKQGVRDMVRLSDSRMSGTSYGACILHVAPESFVGGPLNFVQTGDEIEIDVDKRKIHLHVSDAEMARRKAAWKQPEPKYPRGYGAMFSEHIGQADQGCDFDFLQGKAVMPEPEIH